MYSMESYVADSDGCKTKQIIDGWWLDQMIVEVFFSFETDDHKINDFMICWRNQMKSVRKYILR